MNSWSARFRARPVLLVLLVAFVTRGLLAVVIAHHSGGGLFLDDVAYSDLAADVATGHTNSWGAYEHFLYGVTGTFLVPLAALYEVFGVSPYVGPLLVAVVGAAAAGFTTAIALRVLSRGWALIAGLGVAMLPSQVLFSSVALKDAFVWALLACIGFVVARTVHARVAGLAIGAGTVVLLLFLLDHLRPHTMVVAAWAVALSWLLAAGSRWRPRAALALAVLIFVPLILGAGPAGITLVRNGSDNLGEQRAANAVGARTAFVDPEPSSSVDPEPSSSVDPEPSSSVDPEPSSNLWALPRGLRVMLLEPLPGRTQGNRQLQFALAENLIWWPALCLALVGLIGAGWRRRDALAFPVLAGGGSLVMYALVEGNFGTAYRHRGELVWAVSLLAAVGAHQLAERRRPAVDDDAESALHASEPGHRLV